MSGSRRTVGLLVAAAVLAVAAVVLLVAGVEVRETTGGLLVTPIRQVHLVGGALLAGTAAGVAAVLCALAARPAGRAPTEVTEGAEVSGSPHPSDEPDAAPATTAPGSDRRS
ncbi:hypothetical protein [Actinomycetospora aeridis]|uniref:Uncharacterized protein n=1 Tax=Actinomycetospora aeridis TaxID=3129231 RepID=A0ABU8N9Q9_9PSEU